MKKLFNVSGLLLAMFFAACADIPIENPEQESLNATRAAAGSLTRNALALINA